MEWRNQTIHAWSCLLPCIPGRGHFLYVMTPATPVLLTWSGLPVPGKAVCCLGWPTKGNTGLGGVWGGAKLCRIQHLSSHVRLCESGCVWAAAVMRGVLAEFSRERKKRELFPGMKFLAPLKLRVQLEHFCLPLLAIPPPFPHFPMSFTSSFASLSLVSFGDSI